MIAISRRSITVAILEVKIAASMMAVIELGNMTRLSDRCE
jgi:hypothetical protein